MLFCFVRILISLLQFHLIWGGGGAGLQPCVTLLEWPSHTLLATHFLSSNLKKKPKFQSRSRGWTSLWLLHDQFEQQELRDFSVTLGPNGLFGYAEIKLASRG